ncbi:MAG: response regulator [Pseudomonadota bacterium]
MGKRGRKIRILLIEDDEVDVESVRRSFMRHRIGNDIAVAGDGIAALEWLRGREQDFETRPLIILLDINMPRMNGLEFLRELRTDPALRDLVVFVLTTSADEKDIFAAYDLNVAGYMLKTEVGDGFTEAIRLIDHYWQVVELRS